MRSARHHGPKWVGGGLLVALLVAGAWIVTTRFLESSCQVPDDYATLQAALDDPACPVVQVASGNYTENLRISRAVELRGAGADRVVLNGQDTRGPTVRLFLYDPEAEVTIEGFTISGGGVGSLEKGGVWIGGSSRVTLRKNRIAENGGGGVIVRDDAHITLEENAIAQNEGEGVFAGEAGRLQLHSNRILENTGDGISLNGQTEALITRNDIQGNTGDGVFIWDSARATVEQNLIQLSWWQGITVGESAQATIHDNEIHSNGVSGITAGRKASVTLTNNRIASNGWYGINSVGHADVTAHNNTIVENLRDGVNLEGGATVTLQDNEITDNRACGVLAAPGSRVQGSGNRIRGNGADLCKHVPREIRIPLTSPGALSRAIVPDDYESLQAAVDAVLLGGEILIKAGSYQESLTIAKPVTLRAQGEVILRARSDKAVVVSVLSPGEATLEGVTVQGGFFGVMVASGALTLKKSQLTANQNGLIASGKARVVIEQSAISENFSYGLTLNDSSQLALLHSTVAENRQQGLSLRGGTRAEIRESTIQSNGQEGISLAEEASLLLEHSTISENQSQGISATGTSRLELKRNTFSQNGEAGVIVLERSQVSAVHNEFSGNQFGLLVRGKANGNLEDNFIQGGQIGVQAGDRARLNLIQNGIARNAIGVQLAGQTDAVLRDNRLEGNRVGVLLADKAQVQIESNVFTENDLWEIATWMEECFPNSRNAPAAFSGTIRGSGNDLKHPKNIELKRALCGDVPHAIFDPKSDGTPRSQSDGLEDSD